MGIDITGKVPINIQNKPIQKNDNIPKPYKDIASGMEKQFLEYMIEKMKATVSEEEEPSSAKSYYDSLKTAEQARIIAEKDEGLGIQEMILNQIYPKNKRTNINAGEYQKGSKL